MIFHPLVRFLLLVNLALALGHPAEPESVEEETTASSLPVAGHSLEPESTEEEEPMKPPVFGMPDPSFGFTTKAPERQLPPEERRHTYGKMRATMHEKGIGTTPSGKPWKLPKYVVSVRARHGLPFWIETTINKHTLDCPLKVVEEKGFGDFVYKVADDCEVPEEAKYDSVYRVMYEGTYNFYWKHDYPTYPYLSYDKLDQAFRRLEVKLIIPDEYKPWKHKSELEWYRIEFYHTKYEDYYFASRYDREDRWDE